MALQALAAFCKKHQQTLVAVLITCGVSLGVMTLRHLGAIAQLELRTYDYLLRSRPPEPRDDRILIVAIDEPDIQRMGRWPWTDQMFADLIKQISKGKPAVIGIDKYLDIPVVDQGRNQIIGRVKQILAGQLPAPVLQKVEEAIADRGRANLVQAMQQAGNVVNVTLSPTAKRQAIPLPADLAQVSDQGFANIISDDAHSQEGTACWGLWLPLRWWLPTTTSITIGKKPLPLTPPLLPLPQGREKFPVSIQTLAAITEKMPAVIKP
jgi:Predicted transmembrane sensor domain